MHQNVLDMFARLVQIRYEVSLWDEGVTALVDGELEIECFSTCLLLESERDVLETLKVQESELADLHTAAGDAIILTRHDDIDEPLAYDSFAAYFSSGLIRTGQSGDVNHLDALGLICEAEAEREDPFTEFRHDFDCWQIKERQETKLFPNLLTDPFSLIDNPVVIEDFGKSLLSNGFSINRGNSDLLLWSALAWGSKEMR